MGIAELEPPYLHGFRRNVKRDEAMNGRSALHQVMANHGGNSAPLARKCARQRCSGLVGVHAGDALDPATEGLHEDRSVRTKPRLFWTDVPVEIVAGVEIRRLEQPEVGE